MHIAGNGPGAGEVRGLRVLTTTQGGDLVGWRLVVGNGRPVAVCRERYDDAASALAAFADAITGAEALTPVYVHLDSAVDWTWQAIDAAGDGVASAPRAYARRGTCDSAYRRFVTTARALGPDDVARLAEASGWWPNERFAPRS